jgi:hypothetical protein
MMLLMLQLLICWGVLNLALAHAFPDRKRIVAWAAASGWLCGISVSGFLFLSFKGELPFTVLKAGAGLAFLLYFFVATVLFYSPTATVQAVISMFRFKSNAGVVAVVLLAAFFLGAHCAARIISADGGAALLPCLVLALAGFLVLFLAIRSERQIPAALPVTVTGLVSLSVALLLLVASSLPRLDLFTPLTMKVMKFIHDFVHQFFESMLIPDHPFFRNEVWNYIGLLFSSGVGFWGGLLIWFAPSVLLLAALGRERLPTVAHIRQGVKRRKQLHDYLVERRSRLIIPSVAMIVMAVAVYQSCFPAVEYWNPKPVPISANSEGDIFLVRKSAEIDLDDGRLHKFMFQRGAAKVRFFVLMKPDGQMTVDLDACSICLPDGYGQAGGTVICYYCKTLIPLETVGKPGGCNPVPVPFKVEAEGVRISGQTLVAVWQQTVQTVKKGPGGGK